MHGQDGGCIPGALSALEYSQCLSTSQSPASLIQHTHVPEPQGLVLNRLTVECPEKGRPHCTFPNDGLGKLKPRDWKEFIQVWPKPGPSFSWHMCFYSQSPVSLKHLIHKIHTPPPQKTHKLGLGHVYQQAAFTKCLLQTKHHPLFSVSTFSTH